MNRVALSPYSFSEELLNAITHGIGAVLSIWGLVYLLFRAEGGTAVTSAAIYGGSLILMFIASTCYHSITIEKIKSLLKLIDHSAIYLLIAGTYTPFLLVGLDNWVGIAGVAAIWTIALIGVIFKAVARHRFPRISLTIYLLMGWLAVIFIYPLYKAIPANGLWLLLAGGICFSIGVFFYVAKKVQFTHAIWHCFVIAGCCCHFFGIYHYVL